MAEGSKSASSSRKKPLLRLIKLLIIPDDNKPTTLLDNVQIIHILNMEFDLDVRNMHALERDIYVNLIKKFLKGCPYWDEFEVIVNDSKNSGNIDKLDSVLEMGYNKLKEYLKEMLTASHNMVKEAVDSITASQSQNTKTQPEENSDDVIMEVHCTRDQLNTLFFRRPLLQPNYSIFNVSDVAHSKIKMKTLSLKSIMNWFKVKIHINSNKFSYTRKNTHRLQQFLINKKVHGDSITPVPLDVQLQTRANDTNRCYNTKHLIDTINLFKKKLRHNSKNEEISNLINVVFTLIQNDIQQLKIIATNKEYRKFLNKFAYIRYLYKDTDTSVCDDVADKYDIQLEETVSPAYEFTFRIFPLEQTLKLCNNWFKLVCLQCDLKFGVENIDSLKNHFMEVHNEPDWQCTNCNKVFSMARLTENGWIHKC